MNVFGSDDIISLMHNNHIDAMRKAVSEVIQQFAVGGPMWVSEFL